MSQQAAVVTAGWGRVSPGNGMEGKAMDFRPLNELERRQLITALRGNADGNRVLLMDRRDTSFAGTADDVPDEEVINAIKSVPCHY